MFQKTERMRTQTVMWLPLLLMVCAMRSEAEPVESENEASLASPPPHAVTASDKSADGDDDSADEEKVTNVPAIKTFTSRLTVHGFLSQAYAVGHYVEIPEELPEGITVMSPTSLEATLGIPDDGTTKYRNLALQFRYDITPKDIMMIQLSSEALGFSPISDMKDEIEIDWAFYEHRFGKDLRVKVGRIPIPKGIYNEIRDAGTVLPFYHPPWSIYLEGVHTSEAVDGISWYNTFWPQSSWNLDAAIWGGSYDNYSGDPTDPTTFVKTHVQDAFGQQVWLNTPHSGLRFGLSSSWADVGDAGFFQDLDVNNHIFSMEATFTRLVLRGEWMHDEWDFSVPFGDMAMDFHNYYGQVGYLANDRLQIWLQLDALTGAHEADLLPGGRQGREKLRETKGISLVYQFNPNVVLKAEHHLVKETQAFFAPAVGPGGPAVDRLLVHLDHGDNTIVSLSVAF